MAGVGKLVLNVVCSKCGKVVVFNTDITIPEKAIKKFVCTSCLCKKAVDDILKE